MTWPHHDHCLVDPNANAKAQLIKENRVQECAMLEKHIIEARAKALAYEEREMERQKRSLAHSDLFAASTVGSVLHKSYFAYCLDDALLREHGLLVPADYSAYKEPELVPMPSSADTFPYRAQTFSSKQRTRQKAGRVLPPINSSQPTASGTQV